MPQAYLRPDEVNDSSLEEVGQAIQGKSPAEQQAIMKGTSLPARFSGGQSPEMSVEDFMALGAEAPQAGPQLGAEISVEEFMGIDKEPEKPLRLEGRVAQPGERFYKKGVTRLIYDREKTTGEKLLGAVEGVATVADVALDMVVPWLAQVPAGYRALGQELYRQAGGNVSIEEIQKGITDLVGTISEAPWKLFTKTEGAQVIEDALGSGMEKGIGAVENAAIEGALERAKARGATAKEANDEANLAGSTAKFAVDYAMNLLPFGGLKTSRVKPKAKAPPAAKPAAAPDWLDESAKAKEPEERPTLYVDPQGTAMSADAMAARDALKARTPEAFKPTPEMEPSSARGASLAEQLDERFRVTTEEERKALHTKRGRDIREAFKSDKDYADYLRWTADNQAAMREMPPEIMGPPQVLPHESALAKVAEGRRGELTAEEATALKQLTPDDWNAMRAKRGLSVYARPAEAAPISPKTLAKLGLTAGVVAAVMPYASEEQLQQASLLAAALAIKPKGGRWRLETKQIMATSLAQTLTRSFVRGLSEADLAQGQARLKAQEVAEQMVGRYIDRHAATASDPLRDVLIPSARFGGREDGFGRIIEGLTTSEKAKEIVRARDESGNIVPSRDWLRERANANPDELIYRLRRSSVLNDYLAHVGDYLVQNVAVADLPKMGLVQAVRETVAWDAAKAKKAQKAFATGEGTAVYKTYPDGLRWVELGVESVELPKNFEIKFEDGSWRVYEDGKLLPDKLGPENDTFMNLAATKAEAEANIKTEIASRSVRQEGEVMGSCVGGYCDDVIRKDLKVYSLRDEKGQPHVTLGVKPARWTDYSLPELERFGLIKPEEAARVPDARRSAYSTVDLDTALGTEHGTSARIINQRWEAWPDKPAPTITQIKGKSNLAPVAKYLPAVQDFIKSGKWREVKDLENAGMVRTSDGGYLTREEANRLSRILPDQGGRADPKLLGRLAAIGLGATAGAVLDEKNPFAGAVLGALGGGLVTSISPRAAAAKIKGVFAPDKRIRIADLGDRLEYTIRSSARAIWQTQNGIIALVPDATRRSAISHWLEGDKTIKLSPEELKAAETAREFFNEMKTAGLEREVLHDALENYVTHLWKMDDKMRGFLEAKAQAATMSPNTRFAKQRYVPTLAEGMKPVEDGGWGLTPLTEDIAEIMGVYGNSVVKAMANREALTALRTTKTPDGKWNLVEKADDAPASYNYLNHPQLQGYRVHPDIAPSLRFLFDNKDPNVLIAATEGLNTASKRMLVSFSMFHAKALTDAYLAAASGGPIAAAKNIPKFLTGDHVLLKQLREGGAGDLVDTAIKGGLMFSLERGALAVEDVGKGFYKMMQDAQRVADAVIPGLGKVVVGFEKVNHLVDKYMWERLHAGMKLQIFAEKYERLLETNAKAHERDPRVPLKSKEELAKISASFTNDMFGGLNWRMLAEEATTKLGRDLAQAVYSPSGRRAMQFAMFAPDWTISTTRAALKAFGGKWTFSGVVEPKTLADLHRQYVLRSALYYGLIGTVLNQAFSGKWLWENADPTYINMGDGRRMQWSKHTMEPVHWLTHPRQQALNKTSQIIKIPVEQLMGVQYLSASGHAPRIEEGRRLAHAGKALSPIAVQQGFEAGEGSGIAGFLGAPIYGQTTKQKEAKKEARKLDYDAQVKALERKRQKLEAQR